MLEARARSNLAYSMSRHDIVFIWIPKTAGTTIFEFLELELDCQLLKSKDEILRFSNQGAISFGHVSYLQLRTLGVVHPDFHERAYKFCFCRSPYKRAVSLFNFYRERGRIKDGLCFEGFLDLVHRSRPPVGLYNVAGLSQSNPQVDWIIGAKNEVMVNKVFKLENLTEFARIFQQRYGISFDLHENANPGTHEFTFESVRDNRAALEKIELIYARDFDVFGYERLTAAAT